MVRPFFCFWYNRYTEMGKMQKVTVVLLTWKRIPKLKDTMTSLLNQTYKDFNIHISNGNLDFVEKINTYIKKLRSEVPITVSHDGNDKFTFRRFEVCQRLVSDGTDIVLFIDDDVIIPDNYVEMCLNQYEPKTYKSGYAWNFQDGGSDYYNKRTRRYDNEEIIHYCGTAMSMIDASIFLDDNLINNAPEASYKIEDLWLSYYADSILGWKLQYLDLPGASVIATDGVSLARQVLYDKVNKKTFLKQLIELGWNIKDNK